MCGIAGAIGLTEQARPSPDMVRRMCGRVAHRGPDGEGVWVSPTGRACLGHRRLSVIDLATGQQPMLRDGGGAGLVFNGEIYNYVELRQDLQRVGETFRTTSDTEVLLKLLARDGADALDALRGMFAFVFWDDQEKRLLIARDRIGKKPLYYWIHEDILYFASSLRALRVVAPTAWRIDPVALDRFFTFGYVPAPETIFAGVRKLSAGTFASLGAEGLEMSRFWDLATRHKRYERSYEHALQDLRDLVEESVKIRLRSDVPVGVYLSGGVDSSIVTAIAAARSSTSVETFSIGFAEKEYDESGHARMVAERLGTKHRMFQVGSDILRSLPQLVAHFGEPHADSSALPMWALARETRRHVTVALGGDGGDEGFAGYNWYRTASKVSRHASWFSPNAARLISDALRFGGSRQRPALGRIERGLRVLADGDAGRRFGLLRSLMSPSDKERLYSLRFRDALQDASDPLDTLADAYHRYPGDDLRRMQYADVETYLADNLMPKADVTSMAFGLELRAPLLDQDIVDFAFSLPPEYLADDAGGKRILRDLLTRVLPDVPFDWTKRGFTPPVSRWLLGELKERVEHLDRASGLEMLGMTDPAGVASLVAEHMSGARDHGARIYALLILDEWARAEFGEGEEARHEAAEAEAAI